MRMLFNHGLSAEQLYTNTPDRITDKKKQYFKNLYGDSNSREDSISAPFRYCMGLIINKILDEKLRFKMPNPTNAYIDFEVINEDLFEMYKQRGAFPDVDFIESDFTGYYLRYFYPSKTYQKKITVYLGGDLKKKFIEKVNSGEKLYTTKDFTLKDVLNDVHKEFKELDKDELYRILTHGLRRMHSAILYGCFISITAIKHINCYAFFGDLYTNEYKQAASFQFRMIRKVRKMETWRPHNNDFTYYVGITPERLKEWAKDNKNNRQFSYFKKVMVRKLLEELVLTFPKLYIFKYTAKSYQGFLKWEDNLKIRNVEFIGESISGKFKEVKGVTWKQLMRETNEMCK